MKGNNSKHSSARSVVTNEIVLKSEDLNKNTPAEPARKRKTKSLDQLGNRQLKNRTNGVKFKSMQMKIKKRHCGF